MQSLTFVSRRSALSNIYRRPPPSLGAPSPPRSPPMCEEPPSKPTLQRVPSLPKKTVSFADPLTTVLLLSSDDEIPTDEEKEEEEPPTPIVTLSHEPYTLNRSNSKIMFSSHVKKIFERWSNERWSQPEAAQHEHSPPPSVKYDIDDLSPPPNHLCATSLTMQIEQTNVHSPPERDAFEFGSDSSDNDEQREITPCLVQDNIEYPSTIPSSSPIASPSPPLSPLHEVQRDEDDMPLAELFKNKECENFQIRETKQQMLSTPPSSSSSDPSSDDDDEPQTINDAINEDDIPLASLMTQRKRPAESEHSPAAKKPRLASCSEEQEEEIEYLVDRILRRRYVRGKPQYLLKWKGYSKAHNSWEPEENLNCPELLKRFKMANPPRTPRKR